MQKEIKGIECKFVVHLPSYTPQTPDGHLVKEVIHYTDGTTKPNLRIIKDFKRPFYATTPSKRNHQQKKETEHLDNLMEFQCTQSQLRDEVAKVLEKPWSRDSLRQLHESPYIYGSDLKSTAIIKKRYQDRYPYLFSKFTVATFDIETDVINGTKQIIMASLTMQGRVFTVVVQDFVKGFTNVDTLFKQCCHRYIGEYIVDTDIELYIAEDPAELVKAIFQKAHEWKPDWLAIWNINFDLPHVLNALKEANIDPKDVLCDPSIPADMRICKYKEGPSKKLTASGTLKPLSFEEQWHTLFLSASFYAIDAACVYKQIRLSKQNEHGYGLDDILNKELGIRKLKFKEADAYEKLRWHQFMQANYKLEYMVYNVFDCLSMLVLDEKTKDLCMTMPKSSEISDFCDFKSQPRRIADAYHYYVLNSYNHILGTVGPKPVEPVVAETIELSEDDIIDYDENGEPIYRTLGLRQWILTLTSHCMVPGIKCIAEDPTIRTNIRTHNYDSDTVAAYPTATEVANVSKATTKRELISIEGIPEEVFRIQNLNLVLGPVNAIEYTTTMFNTPKPQDLLQQFLLAHP